MTVQNREELEHVYNLTRECKTYLEVGTAEGNTLHVLGNNMNVTFVDLCEPHTEKSRKEVQKNSSMVDGNSHDFNVIKRVNGKYDFVLIDAGHKYTDVIADAYAYGLLATKYILFHDIRMLEVAAAFSWFVQNNNFKNYYKFVRSEGFGYGVIEL